MNIRDKLIRAKVPPQPSSRPKRTKAGMVKCNKPCPICPFVKEQKKIRATFSDTKVHLQKYYTCDTDNMIYMLECCKCRDQYIGQSKGSLRDRFTDHIGYVRRKENKSTGNHFNLRGHSMSDMSISVLEQVKQRDRFYRETRESYWIEQFNLKFKGMNKKR